MSKLYANAFNYTSQAFFIAGFFCWFVFYKFFYLKYSDLKLFKLEFILWFFNSMSLIQTEMIYVYSDRDKALSKRKS